MGMVSVQAFYLPWCLVALNVAMGGPMATDLLVRPRRRERHARFRPEQRPLEGSVRAGSRPAASTRRSAARTQGIVAGHVYYFCVELYPRAHGVNIVTTPQFMYVPRARDPRPGRSSAGRRG